jgi:hypothetical protein
MIYKEIKKCRVGESSNLIKVLSLGEQKLTGVFPSDKSEKELGGPVDLVWCPDSGLLQMLQSYSLDAMYGDNYGYRSGLNKSMVDHLNKKIKYLENYAKPKKGDLVIDIGSNDATSLKAYEGSYVKVGIDPTGLKFKEYYTDDIKLIPDFFTAEKFKNNFSNQKAKIITSIAMFYDLESPIDFAKDIHDCICDDGIWHFEQSYMPSMLKANSYDTICHEHLEFYSLAVVKHILEEANLKIIDVQMNSINGGSFAVTACKKSANYQTNGAVVNWLLEEESKMRLNTVDPYKEFAQRVYSHRSSLKQLITSLVADGKKVFGYGASTKGNVMLQYCGFTEKEIPFIAEVNEEKFGKFTPGTNIPIISENEAALLKPDYYLVLPWHFRDNILAREQDFLKNNGKFIFPFPYIEIV